MKILIDGDLFCYRCAASAELEEADIAKYYVDRLLDECITSCNANEYQFYLTGSGNFRYQIYPEYKANRLTSVKPRHLEVLREYLMIDHKAIMSDGCEADDLMGRDQDKETGTTTIVSLDKDMLMIPGKHFSWYIEGGTPTKRWSRPSTFRDMSNIDGLRHFYTQLLTGDVSDNIKGCAGIGKVRADKILGELNTEREMFDAVRDTYGHDEAMLMNGQVLWIWRKSNDIWEFPFDTRISESQGQDTTEVGTGSYSYSL